MQSYTLANVKSVKVTLDGQPVALVGNKFRENNFSHWAGPKGVFFQPDISNYTEGSVINVQIEDTNSLYNYTLFTTSCSTTISDEDFDKKFGRKSYNYGQDDPTERADEGDVPKKKSKAGVIVAVVIVLLLLIIGAIVGFFVWRKFCRKSSNDFYQPKETSAPVTQTTTTTTTTSSTSFGRTLTFESRQEEYSGGNSDVNRKTIIIS